MNQNNTRDAHSWASPMDTNLAPSEGVTKSKWSTLDFISENRCCPVQWAVQGSKSKRPCLGRNCSNKGVEVIPSSRAKFRNNATASTSRPKYQVRRRLFKNCELSPRRFFSKDWQGSIQER